MTRSVATLALMVLTSMVLAGTAFGQGDFYIRSQYTDGKFTGFHEILTKPKEGYHQARYCDRTFWVSSGTVIWTEEQNAAGRMLILEENVGSGRKVVCADNNSFATLNDLGLSEREIAKIRREHQPLDMKSSRIRTIRDAFSQFK